MLTSRKLRQSEKVASVFDVHTITFQLVEVVDVAESMFDEGFGAQADSDYPSVVVSIWAIQPSSSAPPSLFGNSFLCSSSTVTVHLHRLLVCSHV